MTTNKEAYRKGLIDGFRQARSSPQMSVQQFEEQLDQLQAQLRDLPNWKLRLLGGLGTIRDRSRFNRELTAK